MRTHVSHGMLKLPGSAAPGAARGGYGRRVGSTQRAARRANLKTVAFQSMAPAQEAGTEAKGESKCPVARLFGGRPSGQKLSTEEFDYAPFTANYYQDKYRMTMGLEPMRPDRWIEIDEDYEEDMAQRKKLLAEKRDIVLHSRPEAAEANKELLELLVAYLPKRFPDRFMHTEANEFINVGTGDVFDLNDTSVDPLEVASLLVQEDLCLMVPDAAGELKFVSGAVLFPQRWSLVEKIGMDLHRIHVPVPLYEQEIERPVIAFMRRLEVKKPFWRCNWTLSDTYEKFLPLVEEDIHQIKAGQDYNNTWVQEPITAENAGERLCTRMERETLSRFPRTRAILFTIRTHMKPLSRFEEKPEQAAQLATALRNLHPEITQYKTVTAFKPQALEYLDRISAQTPAKREPVMA